jgi:PAS domain S-box-containing protein
VSEQRDDNELRLLAQENGRSVSVARQRAGEELVPTEDALANQSDWLRVTLAGIGDAVVTADSHGRVLSVNAAAERLSGWTEAEVRGRPIDEIFRVLDEDSHRPIDGPAARALRERRAVGLADHARLVARDGTIMLVGGNAAPIRDGQGQVRGVVLIVRSIAERRRAERALETSERELADLFENAFVGLHWVDRAGIILRVNRAELELLGYASEEYVGRHIAEFHADPDVIADILRRLSSGETIQNREARMRCKDGSIKHVLIDSSVLWDGGGFVHARCFTRDITDRKRAEEAQARVASIVESSEDAIISKALDGRIVSWNASAERLFGYRADEVVGRPITLLFPPERYDEEQVILERLHRGERIEHYETVRVTKDGRRLDVSLSISPIRDGAGQIVGASKIARDVTSRKRAEERLATQNSVTRFLAESASLVEAAPKILEAICEHLGWQVGALWYVDERDNVLRCADVYHLPSIDVPEFEAVSRQRTFDPGVGLPGRVWTAGKASWIKDVVTDPNFPRAPVAHAEGLHSAFGLPITLNGVVLGVMEFFSREIREPDSDLLETMTAVGSQIGQFIERRKAEEAAVESEHRLRLAQSVARIGTFDWNIQTGVNSWTPELEAIYGLTPGGFDQTQSAFERLVHPEDRPATIAKAADAMRTGEPTEHEWRIVWQDGNVRWIAGRFQCFKDASGRPLRMSGVNIDITERKRIEEALRRSEGRLASELAAMSRLHGLSSRLLSADNLTAALDDVLDNAIAACGADFGLIQLLNPQTGALEIAAHRGFGADFLEYARTERAQDGAPSARAMQRGSRVVIEDVELDSGFAPHRGMAAAAGFRAVQSTPLTTHDGAILGLLSTHFRRPHTLSDRDDRLLDLHARHAADLIERLRFEEALRETDRRKDEFLAMLAHELRNPLAPIRNAVQIFRGKGLPVPELQWATEVIDRQVHQMTRLVDDLLDVSRITRGNVELRKEYVELGDVLNSAIEATRPLIEKWGHELTVSLPLQPVGLEADPTRLAQVFLNLLNNAAKYTDRGGRIQLTAAREVDHAVVRLKDNGVGIPPEMLARVFDLFVQVDRSGQRSDGGLGIGLTLVQRLVEMHGGTIEARSDGPGRGSEFVVRLPALGEGRVLSAAADAREQVAATPARRILVVDDNRDAADSLGLLLRMMGNEVHTAHDGLEAVGAASAFRPDVILLDIGLPKLNGYEVARRIREQEGGSDVLLIALTGWGHDEDRRRSREAGFDRHLTKPVEFRTLQKLLGETNPPRSDVRQSER